MGDYEKLLEAYRETQSALVACFPIAMFDGTNPAMDPSNPAAMGEVILRDREQRDAEIERLRARQLTPEVLALVRRFLVWREEPAATKWAPGYVEGLLRGMTYLADALPAWVLEAAKDSNPTPRADSGGSGTETNS